MSPGYFTLPHWPKCYILSDEYYPERQITARTAYLSVKQNSISIIETQKHTRTRINNVNKVYGVKQQPLRYTKAVSSLLFCTTPARSRAHANTIVRVLADTFHLTPARIKYARAHRLDFTRHAPIKLKSSFDSSQFLCRSLRDFPSPIGIAAAIAGIQGSYI